jgi:hypothetical protein
MLLFRTKFIKVEKAIKLPHADCVSVLPPAGLKRLRAESVAARSVRAGPMTQRFRRSRRAGDTERA